MTDKPFLNNLNGLRFLAASYTIFFHYWNFPKSHFINNFISHGHISVPFFFLLSGFVLSYSYSTYDFSIKNNKLKYLLNRYIRLAPIYYISMFLAIPLVIKKYMETKFDLLEGGGYFLSHLLMAQTLFPTKAMISFWNTHSWSLSVEVCLYLGSPFLIHYVQKLKRKGTLVLLSFLVLVNSLIFFLSFSPVNLFDTISNYFSLLYFPIFFIGVALARLHLLSMTLLKKYSTYLFATSVILLSTMFCLELDATFYSTFNPLFFISFSLLILGSAHNHPLNSFLGTKMMFTLGEISYAMYILQAPIKLLSQQILSKVFSIQASSGIYYNLYIYFMIILAAYILSQTIDPILRKSMKKRIFNKLNLLS